MAESFNKLQNSQINEDKSKKLTIRIKLRIRIHSGSKTIDRLRI